jgi:preprotein translocase subunit SecF
MYFRTRDWNVVGWFKTVSAISYAIIIAGLLMMAYNWVTKGYPLKLGLSFTGGTDVTVAYKQPVATQQVKDALAGIQVQDASVNTVGGTGTQSDRFTISTQTAFGNTPEKLWNALATVAPLDRQRSEISSVGPSLSREYLVKALLALVIAIGIQFVYIAFRFGWNYIFGLVVVVALVRDALMMIGIYAISGRRADDAFLAAVLTVIGYSVMDTIVILDRIRENVKILHDQPYDRIVNTSILQTMTRSINTLATVVITLVALLAFGGASLQNFAFALLVGICSGGYHSIFYSAPLVAVLRDRQIARERASGVVSGDRPRTVADARAQAAAARDRASVLAARKERREREKAQATRAGGPARYRKKRTALDTPEWGSEAEYEEREYQAGDVHESGFDDGELHEPHEAFVADPHAEELDHEKITLNFDDEPEPQDGHSGHTGTPATTPHL